jgi:hypothetical protein
VVLNTSTSEDRSEMPGKFRNVVLKKDGDQLDRTREKVLHTAKEEKNILRTIKRRKASWNDISA